jgi:hypothetical protein
LQNLLVAWQQKYCNLRVPELVFMELDEAFGQTEGD